MNKEIGLKLIITGDGKVAVVAANEVKAGIAGVAAEANKAGAATQKMSGDIVNNSKQAASGIEALTSSLKGLAIGFVGFSAISNVAKDILNTNREMESLRAQLTALTGTAEKSAQAFEFIQDFAKNTPFEINGLTKAYVLLQNMGIKPTTDVMSAITNQAAKLGGSQETLSGITLALGQAYAKQKLQAEEAMQLIERGVPVYDLLQKATGKNTDELMAMMQAGELTRDVIDQLIAKMGEMASGGNAAAMDTLNGKISNLSDAWHSFEDTLLQDRSEGLIKSIVDSATRELNILARNMNSTIDNQIAHSEARIKTFKDMGAVGQALGDYTGFDIMTEVNKLDALKRKKAELDDQQKKSTEVTNAANEATKVMSGNEKELDKIRKAHLTTFEKYTAELEAAKKAGADPQLLARIKADYEATQAKKGLTEAHKVATKAAKDEAQALKELSAMVQGANPDEKFKADIEKYTEAFNKGTLSIKDYLYYLEKLDNQRNQGNAAQYNAANQPKADVPIVQWTSDMRDANASAVSQQLEAYNKQLDDAHSKTLDLGSVTSAVFDGALGGISSMAGAFSSMVSSIDENTKAMDELNKMKALNVQETDVSKQAESSKKYAAEELKLTGKITEAKISGARQIAGAVSALLKQGSDAQKAAHAIEMGLAGIEMAMQMQKVLGIGAVTTAQVESVVPYVNASMTKSEANAIEGISAQAGAGPYIGFALMAAMAVMMASLGLNTGLSGGAAIPQANPQSPDSGTVLGDPTAKSESIGNLANLLNDIHAKEYRELKGINEGVWKLSSGITDAVTKLFQGGGLKDASGIKTGTVHIANDMIKKLSVFAGPLGVMANSIVARDPISNFLNDGLFGKTKTSITGGGININKIKLSDIFDGAMVKGSQYSQVTEKTSSWFSSSSKSYDVTAPLNKEFRLSLGKIYFGMKQSMVELSKGLNIDISKAMQDYFIKDMHIELRGLSSDAMIKKLNNVLSTRLDTMTTTLFKQQIGTYQKLGEGLFETAGRLVTEIAVVKDALSSSGGSIKGDAIAISDSLIQLAGGIKEFQSQFANYYDKFYNDAEKQQNTYTKLSGMLGDYGIKLADTREGYRKNVDALNLSNAKDREKYDILLRLADSADTYYTYLEKAAEDAIATAQALSAATTKALEDALGTAKTTTTNMLASLTKAVNNEKAALTKSYNDSVKTTQDAIDNLQKSVQSMQAIAQKLKSTVDNIRPMDRGAAQAQLSTSLAIARAGGGVNDASGNLSKALDAVAKPSEDLFTSFTDYQRDQQLTANKIAELSGYADNQLTTAEQQLEIQKTQLVATKAWYDAESARLDLILTTAKDQIDAVNKNTVATLTVTDAINGLGVAIGTQTAAQAELDKKLAADAKAEQDKKDAAAKAAADKIAAEQNAAAAAAKAESDRIAAMVAKLSPTYIPPLAGGVGPVAQNPVPSINGTASGTGPMQLPASTVLYAGILGGGVLSPDILAKYGPKLPGFASGGDHAGGARIVGEFGPELEVTGPSHITNSADTKRLFDNSELIAEIRALRTEVNDLRQSNQNTAIATKKTSDLLTMVTQGGQSIMTTAV